MLNAKTSSEAYETALTSQGSAMREQLIYSTSLEGRLNRLSNSWYNLASTAGDSIIYDSIVVITEGLKNLTNAGNSVVGNLGALAPIFGTVATAAVFFSSSLRGLVVSKYLAVTAAVAQTGATGLLGSAMGLASVAAGGLATALRVLLTTALPVGIAVAGIGFIIEKLTSSMSANIQEQEKFDAYINQNTEALTTNKEAVDELLADYSRLSSARTNDATWDSDKEKEYLHVQQQLGDFFPALISQIDATGQAHLKTTDEIQKEIEVLKDLAKVQAELKLAETNDEFKKLVATLNGGRFDRLGNIIEGSMEDQIKRLNKMIKQLEENGTGDGAVKRASELKMELYQLEQEYAETSKAIQAHIFETVQAVNTLNDINIDSGVAKSINAFITGLDSSKLDATQIKVFAKELSTVQESFQKAVDSGDTELYNKATSSLNDLAKEYKLLDGDLKNYSVTAEDFFKAINNGNAIMVDGEEAVGEFGDAVGLATDALNGYASVAESLAGANQQQIGDSTELIYLYQALSSQLAGYTEEELKSLALKPNKTAEEQALVDTYQQSVSVLDSLLSVYPNLLTADQKTIKSTQEKIKAIELENKANDTLIRAYEASTFAKLTAEQKNTVASAKGTKARIEILKTEMLALDDAMQFAQQYNIDTAEKIMARVNSGEMSFQIAQPLLNQIGAYKSKASELDSLTASLNTNINSIDSFVSATESASKASSSSAKASKKDAEAKKTNNKETEKSIYLTDKFKQTLEALNLEIAKEKALREKLPDTSEKFTSSIKTQLKLEQEKLSVLKQQEKSIQSQIKTGKVKETGVVKQSTTSTVVPGGVSGRLTSAYGNRTFGGKTEFHRGTDIASPLGTRQDSFSTGKVTASGNAIKNGYDKSYGNIVVVQGDDGVKRLYAHLATTIAKIGDAVNVGTQIGTIGSTGNSTGPHLHYETSKNGKLFDSTAEVNAARKGLSVTSGSSSTSTVINGAQQSIDQARSDLNSITSDILNQEQAINELQNNLVDAVLSGYEFRKTNYDKFLENSENRLKKLTVSSEDYRKELDKQADALNAKKKVNQDEIATLQKLISSGTLTEKVLAEYTDRLHELGKVNSEIDISLQGVNTSKLESYIELVGELTTKYDTLRDKIDGNLEYENTTIQGLNTSSEKYTKTLERINTLSKEKQTLNNQELKSLKELINTGGLYGEALDDAKKRLQELRTEIVRLQFDIQEGNFEILINIKNQSDERIDDFQFEIDRAEALRKLQVEGSADYKKYTEELIKQQGLVAQAHLATRDALEAELKTQDITAERKKEVLELLEDEHLAYLQATLAVKEYAKQLEESNKQQLEQIANDAISALKGAYQARRDDHIKLIDEELKREEDAHNKRVKQLNDELSLFRKNTEERLKLIDRQESERGYNEDIDELEKERNKIQKDFDVLSLDTSNEAKSKRKKLQEQLDKIDKDIADKRHDRDIELQKQGLNDLLNLKENEIEGKLELEDESYQAIVNRIDKEKAYWEKHYTDLLNDERKFAKIREDILAGNFANVEKEFAEHIQYLKDSLPGFEDTLDGTMQAVGTSIRQNLIDQLQIAITKIGEFQQASSDLNLGSGFSDGGYNPNTGKDELLNGGNTGNSGSSGSSSSPTNSYGINGTATDADIKVLVGKYLNENVLGQTKDAKLRAAIKAKGDALAAEGRTGGSKIVSNVGFSTISATLDSKGKTKLRGALNAQANNIGDDTLKNFIKNSLASLDTGGMLSTSGNGLDGIGGKLFIGHNGEVVNSPLETRQLLDTVSQSNFLFDKLRSIINPVLSSIPNFNGINNQSPVGDTIEINLNGNFGYMSRNDGRMVGEQIANAILTKKGGNW